MSKEFYMGFNEDIDDELKKKIYNIVEKLRGYTPIKSFQLINDYLKETVKAIDFREDDPALSTAYAALVYKKATSEGFARAFVLILKELGILIDSNNLAQIEKRRFYFKGMFHSFYCVNIFYNKSTYRFSPHTEKICNANMIDPTQWFSNMTCLE